MSSYKILPIPLSGEVSVPGDKSISQRVALLSAIAYGESQIYGYPDGEDASSTLSAIEMIGAKVINNSNGSLTINGTNGNFNHLENHLNLGNSGTGSRLLAGLLAGNGVEAIIKGDKSLSSRPMLRIKEPLEQMGAKIELTGDKKTLPMKVSGGNLFGIEYNMPIASAQVKSCIMFASLYAKGTTKIIEPKKTRDHTEKLFKLFGIPLEINNLSISLKGYGTNGPKIKGKNIEIPGDFSSAAFWFVAAAVRPESYIKVKNVGLNKRRTALLDVLERMGADIKYEYYNNSYDDYGSVYIYGKKLNGTVIQGEEIPNLIDELPILAVAGALAEGKTIIRNAEELRVKESDRISVMVESLKAYGINIEEKKDGMIISGPCKLCSPKYGLKSYGDHRIAMSLAILNTFSDNELIINDIECVNTSYPNFWNDINTLGGNAKKL